MKNKTNSSFTDGSFLGAKEGFRVIHVAFTIQELTNLQNVFGTNESLATVIHGIVMDKLLIQHGIGADDETT